jgi:hypothetical protein
MIIIMIDEDVPHRVLSKVLVKPTPKLATDLTTFVDKVGKAVVRVGNYQVLYCDILYLYCTVLYYTIPVSVLYCQECKTVSDKIDALTRIASKTVLKSRVVPSYVVAHQVQHCTVQLTIICRNFDIIEIISILSNFNNIEIPTNCPV